MDYITKIKNDTKLYVAGNNKIHEIYMQNYYNFQLSNKINSMNLPYYQNNIFFKKANYISENEYTGLIAGIKINYPVGFKTAGIDRQRICPSCKVKSSEFHVIWLCPTVANHRTLTDINIYKLTYPNLTDEQCFQIYINELPLDTQTALNSQQKLDGLKNLRLMWQIKHNLR